MAATPNSVNSGINHDFKLTKELGVIGVYQKNNARTIYLDSLEGMNCYSVDLGNSRSANSDSSATNWITSQPTRDAATNKTVRAIKNDCVSYVETQVDITVLRAFKQSLDQDIKGVYSLAIKSELDMPVRRACDFSKVKLDFQPGPEASSSSCTIS